jgi:Kef-type K+ transport system membrane component KefB
MNNTELAVQFFLQLALILVSCRIVGVVAKWLGQPQVVAEMITGVLLGPSLFGLYWPELQQTIFPWDATQTTRDTQSFLFPVSQLGLALYMFIVGMEFRGDIIRQNYRASLAVSAAGMIAPFVLGASLAIFFFFHTQLFPEHIKLFDATIFLGASMCITAFPMLARIIHFKGLTGTRMGTVAIGAGAIDDAMAWCLLAVVLASFKSDYTLAVQAILGAVAFVAVAFLVVRPVLSQLQKWLLNRQGHLSDSGFVICLACLCLGAWFTDLAGLHAVFGAFVIGAAMPRGVVTDDLIQRIQPLTVGLLLPLFFTFSGLNTQIGLLNTGWLWAMCGLVLVAAVFGKGVACFAAARFSGLDFRESMGVGTLMNARGLMELIIINIGLQVGIISQELFAILVIMAVVTTLMASPIFELLVGSPAKQAEPADSTDLVLGKSSEGIS